MDGTLCAWSNTMSQYTHSIQPTINIGGNEAKILINLAATKPSSSVYKGANHKFRGSNLRKPPILAYSNFISMSISISIYRG